MTSSSAIAVILDRHHISRLQRFENNHMLTWADGPGYYIPRLWRWESGVLPRSNLYCARLSFPVISGSMRSYRRAELFIVGMNIDEPRSLD